MYTVNGIVYGGKLEKPIKVIKVKVLQDKILLVTFSTGETRLFDASILKGKVFEPLENEDVFKEVYVDFGVVTWNNGTIDCAPEFMYENSYEYSEVEELAL